MNDIGRLLDQRCQRYKVEKKHVLEVYNTTIKQIMNHAAPNINVDAAIESREIMGVAKKLKLSTTVALKLPGANVDFQNLNTWIDIYYKIKKKNLTEKEKLVLDAITYLVFTESFYHRIVNILCFALVNRIKPPTQYDKLNQCTTMEDISTKVELRKKLSFLRSDCLELVDACNLDLRDSSAHMQFHLVPDMELVNEIHASSTSETISNSFRTKKHYLYLRKKENRSWTGFEKKPTDPHDALIKLKNVTYSWHVALLHYQAVKWFNDASPLMRKFMNVS